MPQNFKGFTLNKVGEKPKWSAREIQIFKDLITLLVPDKNTPLTDAHHHSNLYRSDDSAVALNVNATGRVNIAADAGTLPALSSDTFFVVNNNSAAGDNVGMSLISGNTGKSSIFFGDTDDEDAGRIEYDHSANDMNFRTNALGGVGLRIDDGHRVGINGNPSTNMGAGGLHVSADSGSIPTMNADTRLLISHSGAATRDIAMSLISGNTANTTINFGDTDDENVGMIDYDHDFDKMAFTVGASLAAYFKSDGKLALGPAIGDTPTALFTSLSTSIAQLELAHTIDTKGWRFEVDTNAHLQMYSLITAGLLSIGDSKFTPSAKVDIRDTTEQLRLAFDAGSYISFTVADNLGTSIMNLTGTSEIDFQSNGLTVITIGETEGGKLSFFAQTAISRVPAYTRNATVVQDRVLLASASATIINNNNVIAQMIKDFQDYGLYQGT